VREGVVRNDTLRAMIQLVLLKDIC
jgi:hypothetical protein